MNHPGCGVPDQALVIGHRNNRMPLAYLFHDHTQFSAMRQGCDKSLRVVDLFLGHFKSLYPLVLPALLNALEIVAASAISAIENNSQVQE
jgi:hypothetical protein